MGSALRPRHRRRLSTSSLPSTRNTLNILNLLSTLPVLSIPSIPNTLNIISHRSISTSSIVVRRQLIPNTPIASILTRGRRILRLGSQQACKIFHNIQASIPLARILLNRPIKRKLLILHGLDTLHLSQTLDPLVLCP